MMRFLSVLADAGIEVFAPCIPSALDLRLDRSGIAEAAAAYKHALESGHRGGLSVFTISFGSILGLNLLADARFQGLHGDLMLFGAYADWVSALRYSITERDLSVEPVPPDPLNQPVVYMNLVEDMPGAPTDTSSVKEAWRRYVKATWGDLRMQERARFAPVADALAATLKPEERPLFLRGCGLEPGAFNEVEAALECAKERLAWLSPLPALRRLNCALHVAHGADDDVVPVTHAEMLVGLAREHTEVKAWVTGLYGHSEAAGLRDLANRGSSALRELRTMLGLLRAIAELSQSASHGEG